MRKFEETYMVHEGVKIKISTTFLSRYLDEIAIILSIHTFDNSLAMTFDRMTFGILTNISLTNMYSDNL